MGTALHSRLVAGESARRTISPGPLGSYSPASTLSIYEGPLGPLLLGQVIESAVRLGANTVVVRIDRVTRTEQGPES